MIIIINGPARSGRTLIANALRNSQITNGNGALLVDDSSEGEVGPLLEKLLVGIELPESPPADLADLPWKPESLIVLVGKKQKLLGEFEKALPGFTAFHGPVRTLTTDVLPA